MQILILLTCVGFSVVLSVNGVKQDEVSQVDWTSKNSEIKSGLRMRLRRSAASGNDVGGDNANGEAATGTTYSPVSNEIQYSESGSNNKWEISLKPMINETADSGSDTLVFTGTNQSELNETDVLNNTNTNSASNAEAVTKAQPDEQASGTNVNVTESAISDTEMENQTSAIDTITDNKNINTSTQKILITSNTGTTLAITHSVSEAGLTTSTVRDQINGTNNVTVTDNKTNSDPIDGTNTVDMSNNTSVDIISNKNTLGNGSLRSSTVTFPLTSFNEDYAVNESLTTSTETMKNTSDLIFDNQTTENVTEAMLFTAVTINASAPVVPPANSSSPADTAVNDTGNVTDSAVDFTKEAVPEPEPVDEDRNTADQGNATDTTTSAESTLQATTINTEGIPAVRRSTSLTKRVTWPMLNEIWDSAITKTTSQATNSTSGNSGWQTVAQSVTTTSSQKPTMTSQTTSNTVSSSTIAKTTVPAIVWTQNKQTRENNSSVLGMTSLTVTFQQPEGALSTKTFSETKQTVSTAAVPEPTSHSSTKLTTQKASLTSTHLQYTTTHSKLTSRKSTTFPLTSDGSRNVPSSEPTSEPSSEPSSEPASEPTSQPETGGGDNEEGYGEEEPNGEPGDGEPEGEPELDFGAFEEPGPDWELAKRQWKEAWEFHIYFCGVCFVILGIYSSACIVRLWTMEHLLSRNYFFILHGLVIMICILRATYLLIDAYNSLGSYPHVVDYFLYNTVFPCIASLFSILFYALLLATRVRILSRKVQKLGVLFAIILFHFVLSISTDLIVGLLSTAHVLMFICQSFFVLWGLLMFIGYLIVFRKLYKGAINRQKNLTISSPDRKYGSPGNQTQESKYRYTFGLAVKITFVCAFFGVAIVGFEMYGMFGVFGILQPNVKPQPWPWWSYHLIVRTLELLMCSSVSYVASQPLRYMFRKDSRLYQYLLPCNVCCCNVSLDRSYDSSTISMENVSETDHLSWLKKKNKKPNAPYPPHASEKYNDPDATLLVRKIRQSKPSMLVVEDGFVRIRRDDEILPPNQYELDSNSRSSQSSGLNAVVSGNDDPRVPYSILNSNYSGEPARARARENMPLSFSLDNYRLPSVCDNRESVVMTEVTDDTDIDIVVTDSEQSDTERDHTQPAAPPSPTSNKSGDIFRPLSMIDLAASMESELERAFHSKCADADESTPEASNDRSAADPDAACGNYGDSSARLLRSPIRRCKSEEKPTSTKCKRFANNRYYSLSSVEVVGKNDDTEFECNETENKKRTF